MGAQRKSRENMTKQILPKLIQTISRNMSSSTKRPYTVIVEGNIGAGKTTFLEPFKKHESLVQVCTEPVDKWRDLQGNNLLQKMYEDPKRWSFELQSYIQLTMVQEHMRPCPVPVKMMERSLLSARYCFVENLFNSGNMEESEYLVLSEWFNFLVSCPLMNFKVDQIIYLRTDPEVVYQRIKNRNRSEENTIPLQYLTDLHNLHEAWLVQQTKIKTQAPVTIIDANGNLDDLSEEYLKCQQDILQHGQNQ